MKTKDFITQTTIYEAYFCLDGLSVGWIDSISDKLLDLSCETQGDDCEAYKCLAKMAVRYQSHSMKNLNKAIALFNKLMNLAIKSYNPNFYYAHA